MTRPKFYKLDDYDMDSYNKEELLKWIKENINYNIYDRGRRDN